MVNQIIFVGLKKENIKKVNTRRVSFKKENQNKDNMYVPTRALFYKKTYAKKNFNSGKDVVLGEWGRGEGVRVAWKESSNCFNN